MVDYGEIYVGLHKGLSKDQKETMIRRAIENQLLAKSRAHYVEIYTHCLALSRLLDDGVRLENNFNNFFYRYTFIIDYPYSNKTNSCLPCSS